MPNARGRFKTSTTRGEECCGLCESAGFSAAVKADNMADDNLAVGEAKVQLSHLRVTQPDGAKIHAKPSADAPAVGRLRRGGVCVSLAEIAAPNGELWHRVAHGVAGDGYMNAAHARPVNVQFEFGGQSDKFELLRAPRDVFPEPPRDAGGRDVTFTITFNGRIGPFFEATGSVPVSYTHLTLPTTPYV